MANTSKYPFFLSETRTILLILYLYHCMLCLVLILLELYKFIWSKIYKLLLRWHQFSNSWNCTLKMLLKFEVILNQTHAFFTFKMISSWKGESIKMKRVISANKCAIWVLRMFLACYSFLKHPSYIMRWFVG